jgi:CheY-like chemotaxis protein
MDQMVRRLLDKDIDLITILGDDLGLIQADPNQLQQVILNLAINAREAMPNGGKLTLKTANITPDPARESQGTGPQPADHIMLTVADTGTGMTDEVKDRIFEPFFTTKDETKGTGLGLATCFGIVKQSGGHIEVLSEVDQGTTFRVSLPVTELEQTSAGADDDSSELPRGTETVLLTEDEPLVRNFVAHMLREQGYNVLEAANGFEALSMGKKFSNQEIHLVLTDIVMPLMSGFELTEQFRAGHPAARVLFMSGYSDRTHVNSEWLDRDNQAISFIQKPFKPAMLIRKVREVLDQIIPDPVLSLARNVS